MNESLEKIADIMLNTALTDGEKLDEIQEVLDEGY